MKTEKTVSAVIFAALICAAGFAQAAPIAPKLHLTKKGKILNYGFKGPCPDAKAVGIPAYPGSVCYGRGAPSKTSRIVYLMTSADAAAVANWYAKKLPGWKRSELKLLHEIDFKPPHKKKTAEQRREDLEEHWGQGTIGPSVTVRGMRKEDVREKKMFYAFDGTPATIIEIDYVITGSKK